MEQIFLPNSRIVTHCQSNKPTAFSSTWQIEKLFSVQLDRFSRFIKRNHYPRDWYIRERPLGCEKIISPLPSFEIRDSRFFIPRRIRHFGCANHLLIPVPFLTQSIKQTPSIGIIFMEQRIYLSYKQQTVNCSPRVILH